MNKRKLIEQGVGWVKTIGRMRQVMVRGLKRVDQMLSYVKDETQKSIHLAGIESRILSKLMHFPWRTVSRNELCNRLGPGGEPAETRRLDTLLSCLRSKVKSSIGQPLPVITYRNLGFVFNGEICPQKPNISESS